MFKTNIFIALMVLTCTNVYGTPENQEPIAADTKQEEKQTFSLPAYTKRTWIGVGVSAAACVIAMYITKDKKEHDACNIIMPVLTLAVLGTGACVITDAMAFTTERDKKTMNFHEKMQKDAMDFEQRTLELKKELALINQNK